MYRWYLKAWAEGDHQQNVLFSSLSLLKALNLWHSPSGDQGGRRKQQSAWRMISQGDGADKDRVVSWRARKEGISGRGSDGL